MVLYTEIRQHLGNFSKNARFVLSFYHQVTLMIITRVFSGVAPFYLNFSLPRSMSKALGRLFDGSLHPRPLVIKPTIGSPGRGLQHFAILNQNVVVSRNQNTRFIFLNSKSFFETSISEESISSCKLLFSFSEEKLFLK